MIYEVQITDHSTDKPERHDKLWQVVAEHVQLVWEDERLCSWELDRMHLELATLNSYDITIAAILATYYGFGVLSIQRDQDYSECVVELRDYYPDVIILEYDAYDMSNLVEEVIVDWRDPCFTVLTIDGKPPTTKIIYP